MRPILVGVLVVLIVLIGGLGGFYLSSKGGGNPTLAPTALATTGVAAGSDQLTRTPPASVESSAEPTSSPGYTVVAPPASSKPTPLAQPQSATTAPTNTPIIIVITATPIVPTATPTEANPTPVVLTITDMAPVATIKASSYFPEETLPSFGWLTYVPENVLDRNPATSWVESADGPGIGQWLLLSFPRPIDITQIGMDIGYDRDDPIFVANNRVQRVSLGFADGSIRELSFADKRGMQTAQLAEVKTTSIMITILDVYKGTKYDDACIAEIEVWGFEQP